MRPMSWTCCRCFIKEVQLLFLLIILGWLVDTSDDLTETCLLQHASICLWPNVFWCIFGCPWNMKIHQIGPIRIEITSKDTQYLDPSSYQSHPKWNSTAMILNLGIFKFDMIPFFQGEIEWCCILLSPSINLNTVRNISLYLPTPYCSRPRISHTGGNFRPLLCSSFYIWRIHRRTRYSRS